MCDHTWAYCPSPSPVALSATNISATGVSSGALGFSIVGLDLLSTNVVAANIGGPAVGYFDWGLSFFFGRPISVAISGASTPGGSGPYFAY